MIKKSHFCFFMLLLLSLLFKPINLFAKNVTNEECLTCHSVKDMTKTGKGGKVISLYEDLEVLRKSVHGKFECVKCHEIKEAPHGPVKEVNCEGCHKEEQAKFKGSIHDESRLSEKNHLVRDVMGNMT